MTQVMTQDWLLRVGDGGNLIRSSKFRIWGIKSTNSAGKHFITHVKPGDRLWFVKGVKSNGKIIAVATYHSSQPRELGPLIHLTRTNEELGWTGDVWTSDTEIHYTDLYGLNKCRLYTHIIGSIGIRRYNEKCLVNLPKEYKYIVKYSKVTTEL